MKNHKKSLIVGIGVFVVVVGFLFGKPNNSSQDWVTETVSQGDVSHIISVSGTLEATQEVDLSFPTVGTLESLSVKEGDFVTKGTLLATLSHADIQAEYQEAYGALLVAQADYAELIAGLRPEERDIVKTKVEIAEEELAQTTKEHDERVGNAYRALLSSDLEALPKDKNTTEPAPTISGTYTCAEGAYIVDVYRSSSNSGYSYRLSGLEKGTYTAYTGTPSPFGNCGLSLQFTEDEHYGNSQWTITIPNPESTSYVTNVNAYMLAKTERENAIRDAEQNLQLARQTKDFDSADPRSEALIRSEAKVLQAEAQLQKISSLIADNTLIAPFDGIIAHIEPLPGEVVSNTPVITLLSKNAFAITALIPEIDITKISIGKKASVVFDARTGESLPATITFIAPIAKEIGGVSYFETNLALDTQPDWLQSGLNADVDIIIEKRENVTRIPRRFLSKNGDAYSVLIPQGEQAMSLSITPLFEGNDGFVEVEGVHVGDTLIAP